MIDKFSSRTTMLTPILFIINMLEILLFAKNFTFLYEHTAYTYTTFSIAAVILTTFVVALFRMSERVKTGEYYLQYNLGLVLFLLIMSLSCYVGGGIMIKKYIPGMATGILLNIPFSIYIMLALKKLELLTSSVWGKSIVVLLILLVLTGVSLFAALLLDPLIYPVEIV